MISGNKASKAIPIRQLVGMAFFILSSLDSIEFRMRSAIIEVRIVG